MYAIQPPEPGRRWRIRGKAILAVGLVTGLLFATGGIADAQTDRARPRQAQLEHVDQVRPQPFVETLRLACSPDVIEGERGILCQWSEAQNPQTRGYKLFRIVDGFHRELVTSVGLDGRRGFFDTDLNAPSSVIYGVISVNDQGRLLGRSAPVHVQFGGDIAQLRLACSPDSIGGQRGVLCRWSESNNSQVRAYHVYRTVDGEPRELIASVGLDGRNANFDTDVSPGALLTYGVSAVDSSGKVLALGGPQQVSWPG